MKIFGLILVILGSFLIALNSIAYVGFKGPGTEDSTSLIAYYIGFNFNIILGAILLVIGISLRKKAKRRKTAKDLLDSLPGDKV